LALAEYLKEQSSERLEQDVAIVLPLYLHHFTDLSESGRDRPSLPQVFKTVSSDRRLFLPQSPLPEVPERRPRGVARTTRR
jgi:hypothetical protein